jgi:hypothetical protein
MVLREKIEQAQGSSDESALEAQRDAIAARRDETMRKIAARGDGLAEASGEEKKAFRQLLNSIRYFDNLLGELAGDPLASGRGS